MHLRTGQYDTIRKGSVDDSVKTARQFLGDTSYSAQVPEVTVHGSVGSYCTLSGSLKKGYLSIRTYLHTPLYGYHLLCTQSYHYHHTTLRRSRSRTARIPRFISGEGGLEAI